MSIRSTIFLRGPVHVFRTYGKDVFVDIATRRTRPKVLPANPRYGLPEVIVPADWPSYNRAWKIWPPTFKRLY